MKLRVSYFPAFSFVCLIVGFPAPVAAQPKPLVAPANTTVAVRLMEEVDSKGASPDKDFRATVDDSVIVDGNTVVAVGTPAVLRLVEVQQAGPVKGRLALSLRLVALEIDGQRVPVRTGRATVRSTSQAGKTTKSGVAGAVVGGLFGALLGGKSGAAKGAALGAAAGVTVAAVSGQRVQIPAETRMSFKLRPEYADPLIETLLNIEEDSFELSKAGDKKAIEKMLAKEFTFTSNGRQLSRKEFLSLVKPTPDVIEQYIDDATVERQGDRVVLRGIATLHYQQTTGVAVQRVRFTSVFVFKDGDWFYLANEVGAAPLESAEWPAAL